LAQIFEAIFELLGHFIIEGLGALWYWAKKGFRGSFKDTWNEIPEGKLHFAGAIMLAAVFAALIA
jgi:hypothetical protein